jgi:hypothetical protein
MDGHFTFVQIDALPREGAQFSGSETGPDRQCDPGCIHWRVGCGDQCCVFLADLVGAITFNIQQQSV